MLLILSSILDFRGLYFCAAYFPANNLKRISTTYLRGYWKGSENGRVVTIGICVLMVSNLPFSTILEFSDSVALFVFHFILTVRYFFYFLY